MTLRDIIEEAKKHQVFPLDASVGARIVAPRPNITAGRTEFVYSRPMTGLPQGDSPTLLNSSYTITADIEVPAGGAEGMVLTSGGRFAGYGFYLLKGKPVFLWNFVDLKRIKWEGSEALAPGKHTIEFDFKYDGPGPGKGGTGVLSVDVKELSRQKIDHTIPLLMSIDETFDVGIDTRTPVDDSYKLPFRFTGKINKLTFNLGREQMTAEEREEMQKALARARD